MQADGAPDGFNFYEENKKETNDQRELSQVQLVEVIANEGSVEEEDEAAQKAKELYNIPSESNVKFNANQKVLWAAICAAVFVLVFVIVAISVSSVEEEYQFQFDLNACKRKVSSYMQEFKIDYTLSYCGLGGNFCETIYEIEKVGDKTSGTCGNDPNWEDESYIGTYDYVQRFFRGDIAESNDESNCFHNENNNSKGPSLCDNDFDC